MLAMVLLCAGLLATSGRSAHAAGLPSSTFGAQVSIYDAGGGQLGPSNLQLASQYGLGTVRYGAFNSSMSTSYEDQIVRFLATMHLRLYPILGVVCTGCQDPSNWKESPVPAVAAADMSSFIKQFAARYGDNGSFWKANPALPYEPVQNFEIGNEPNLPTQWVVDSTHLHYAATNNADNPDGPASYAQVYEAAERALHSVDPTGVAVVGGLGDSAKLEVDVPHAALYVKAIPPSLLDAVGYHAWTFDVSDDLLKPDTQELRNDMNSYGDSSVPIQVSEIGACDLTPGTSVDSNCPVNQTSAQWGSVMAAYTQWAACTPSLHIDNIDAYLWGGLPNEEQDAWLPLLDSSGTATPYGNDFFGVTHALTTSGCPSSGKSSAPTTTGTGTGKGTAKTKALLPMNIRIVRVRKHGLTVTVTLRRRARSGAVSVSATQQRVRLHHTKRFRSHRVNTTTLRYTARLAKGRWRLTVTGKPSRGYAKPKALHRVVVVRRR